MTARKGPGSPLAGLQDWYRSPLGTEVAALESACVQRLLSDTFGYYLVQIGVTESFRDAMASSRIRHRILMPCEQPSGHGGREIVGLPSRLPLASDAIDALLLPHTLDFSPDPEAVLREVERVLIPEGRVIILGFNALSAWGLWSLLRGSGTQVPWCGRFRTAYQIEDWLSVLGFDIELREHIMFRPPFRRALGPSCAAFDTLGRRLWPILGGVYLIRAVKRVSTLTPLRPAWGRQRSLLRGGAVEPTTRGTGHV
ncbi:Methyltransferase type 11 [Thiocapsa sp. KS1]|jgi:SAM-dependent methyltransferase|nr:methyltransferase domain-containing protein [Thiocapsa sp. KS1]CRI63591.1 Methyltransferase type 11 [Thiocapsa sp. KS1]